MKNPKHFVGIMIGILFVVWIILRSSENLGTDLQKNRISTDTQTGLNIKSNTFTIGHKKPMPIAPSWGSFKSQPEESKSVEPAKDKNEDLLKKIVQKANDKMKAKKKEKKIAKRKKRGVKLINTAQSRVERALGKFGENFKSQSGVVPVSFAVPRPMEKATSEIEEPKKLRTLEDWEHLLLRQANTQAVEELIEAYKKNELGQKEWLFILAEQMIESDNVEIQKNGLVVLDAVPSEKSFSILAKHSAQYDDEEMNQSIKKSLDIYSFQIEFLTVLEKSVLGNDPVVQIQGSKSIELSADYHLTQRGRSRRSTISAAAAPRERFVTTHLVLTAASQKAQNPDAKSAIDHAITVVESKLNPSIQTQLVFAR